MGDSGGGVHPAFTRPGVVALLALAAGHFLAEGLRLGAWQPGFALAVTGFLVLLFSHPRHVLFACGFALTLAGIGAAQEGGSARAAWQAGEAMARFAPEGLPLAQVTGVLAEPPRRSGNGWLMLLAPGATVEAEGRSLVLPAPLLMTRSAAGPEGAAAEDWIGGDTVSAAGPLEPRPAGRSGAVAALRARQIRRLGVASGPIAVIRRVAHSAGIAAGELQQRALPGAPGGLLAAITLGHTHLLTPEQRDAWRRAGLYHVFSVSGLHTTAIGGLLLFLLSGFGLRPGVRLAVLAVLLLFFCGMVGMRPPVLRSAAMLLLFEARHLLRRPAEPLAVLGTIATGLALVWPESLRQLDFQMSFLCILALTLLSPWQLEVRRLVGKRLGWGPLAWLVQAALRTFLASCAIQLVLLPVLVSEFGDVSLVAPLANMLFLWLATGCFLAGAAGVLLMLAWPAGGAAVVGALAWPLLALDGGVGLVADLPAAVIHGYAFPLWAVALFYLLLAGAAWHRDCLQTQPRRSPWTFAPAALGVVAVLFLGTLPARPPGALDVWFLDVGQGDAVLIRCPNGAAMLVDAGPSAAGERLPEMLEELGIRRLDAVVATHADADHIGGMAALLRALPASRLVVGGSVAATEDFEDLASAVRDLRLPVTTVRRGAAIGLDDAVRLDVLHPDETLAGAPADRNDASVVLRVEFAGRRLLLTGDAEEAAEESLLASGVELRADVLKAGHHGSRGSSSRPFLERVRPALAVLSCGRLNHYGHPHPELLERLGERRIAVRRTDREGTIHLRIAADGDMAVRAERTIEEPVY